MELVIDRLTMQYQNKIAVDRISYTLHNGVYGLLGGNGAGKTTLMRMICGILKPTGGEITFDGFDVNQEAYRNALGYLPQNFGYYPEFSAMDFLLYLSSLKGIPKQKAKLRANELLELVSLSEVANKKIKTFSGGMKQRLGIAQAMLNDPKILILDEPTAGLDPKERIRFRNLISKMSKEKIVLLSTHIVSDIEYIASVVLMMKSGQLIHTGSTQDILKTIEGKVYECTVDRETASRLTLSHPIINIRENETDTFVRLISDEQPTASAVLVPATLEDLYLYYFSKEEDIK